jgi:uncharacterized protein (TIGR00369 family)
MTKVGPPRAAGSTTMTDSLDATQVESLIDAHFPQIHAGGRIMVIEETALRSARVRMKQHDRNMRPGGTVSGPALFTLADFSVYVALIGTIGATGIEAVTTSLNINFLAKPSAGDVVSSVRIIRLGRRIAVGEAQLFSEGAPEMVAHAVANYVLPQIR